MRELIQNLKISHRPPVAAMLILKFTVLTFHHVQSIDIEMNFPLNSVYTVE